MQRGNEGQTSGTDTPWHQVPSTTKRTSFQGKLHLLFWRIVQYLIEFIRTYIYIYIYVRTQLSLTKMRGYASLLTNQTHEKNAVVVHVHRILKTLEIFNIPCEGDHDH